jgi:hypothetical protein
MVVVAVVVVVVVVVVVGCEQIQRWGGLIQMRIARGRVTARDEPNKETLSEKSSINKNLRAVKLQESSMKKSRKWFC